MPGAVDKAYGKNLPALTDGKSNTTKEAHMWSCPFSQGQRLTLTFTLPHGTEVLSYFIIRFLSFNYEGLFCFL